MTKTKTLRTATFLRLAIAPDGTTYTVPVTVPIEVATPTPPPAVIGYRLPGRTTVPATVAPAATPKELIN